MNDSPNIPARSLGRRLPRFSGNKQISIYNPRDVDAIIMDRLEALSNIEVRTGTKAGAVLSDRRLIITVPPGTAPAAASNTKTFQITAIGYDDFFTAQTLDTDGVTLGGTDILIAKKIDFRMTLVSEVVDGVTITHTFSDENHRTSDDGSNSQNEVCWPRYVVGAEIQAALCSNGTPVGDGETPPNDVEWIDLTSRVWMTY